MEFEYTGTIYFNIDYMVEDFVENDNWDDIKDYIRDYVSGLDDCDYYNVEEWMIDELATKMLEYEGVKAKVKG